MGLSFAVTEADRQAIGSAPLTVLQAAYGGLLAPRSFEAELSLAEPAAIRSLNRTYRGLDEPTDVLSFPVFADPLKEAPEGSVAPLGSVVICPEKAAAYGETLPQLVHHGLMHLLGYDHETDRAAWLAKEGAVLSALETAGLAIPGLPSEPSL